MTTYQAHCGARSCGAPITWTTSAATGSHMPVDTAEDPKGNVAVRETPSGPVSRVITGSRPVEDGETLHMPHHATCTRAEAFRRNKANTARPTSAPVDGLW